MTDIDGTEELAGASIPALGSWPPKSKVQYLSTLSGTCVFHLQWDSRSESKTRTVCVGQ